MTMTDASPLVSYTKKDTLKLCADYNHAIRQNDDTFTNRGREMLTKYAYYLIQHLAKDLGFKRIKIHNDQQISLTP